jgi:hypothetical protein
MPALDSAGGSATGSAGDQLATGLNLEPISERQLRDRLKKICHHPGKPATFIFQLFPELEPRSGD